MTNATKAGWEVEGFIDRLTRRDDSNSERLVLEAISHLRAFSRDCDALRESNRKLRGEIESLQAALDDIEFIIDGKEDADDGTPNDAMKIMAVVQTARRAVE